MMFWAMTIASCIILMGIVALWLAVILRSPMTVCVSFDDGFKVHSDIAAPMMKRFGWCAAFNVPTDFMESRIKPLTQEQLWDCRLVGNADNLMNWQDVIDLISDGHDVFPHTCGHVDLKVLEQSGEIEELRRQIAEAKLEFVRHTGVVPKFFCSPHNSFTPLIKSIIHECGMELFEPFRPSYGAVSPDLNLPPIDDYLRKQYRGGARNVTVMIHGIGAERGGWRPFATVADFEDFLKRIKSVEEEGLVRVVPYSSVHRGWSAFATGLNFYDRVCAKMRREAFARLNFLRRT